MSTPLSRVIQARLAHLELTKDELADRSGLGRSTIYAFVSGSRTDPQGSTLRKLAEGLSMAPGELVEAVNGTPIRVGSTDERIARIMQLLPGVPKDRLDAIEQHVTLAIQPARRRTRTGRRDDSANARSGHRAPDDHGRAAGESGLDGLIPTVLRRLNGATASTLSAIRAWLQPSNPWSGAQPAR